MSPGSVTERIAFFTGSYRAGERVSTAAASRARARTSRSSRSTLAEAIAMVERGEIVDGKTVLLLRLAQFA